jgi:hypothetical protein
VEAREGRRHLAAEGAAMTPAAPATDDLPEAVWEGSFQVFGVPVRAYILSDGRRILNADDVHALLADERGGCGTAEEAEADDGMWAMAAFCRGAPERVR